MKSNFSRILALKCARFLLAGGAVILACVRPACAAPQTTGGSIIVDYGDAGYAEGGTWENARDTWDGARTTGNGRACTSCCKTSRSEWALSQ